MSSSAQNIDTPVDYLSFIGVHHQDITKQMWKYTKAIAHGKSDRNVNRKRKKLIGLMEEAIATIKKTESYNKENDFKDRVINNLEINKSLMNNEYEKVVNMKEVAEQSYDMMEAYMMAREMADQKMEEAQKDYENYFNEYAKKYSITINDDESDLGKKMRISNQVFDHYNDTYLIFFKSYMNEKYLMEALQKKDVSVIQQTANALKASAEEGIMKLDTLTSAYKDDKALINRTKKVLNFYINEVDNHVPNLTNFVIANEDFETIKKNLDNTPKNKRTKEMIDAYNTKINEMNNGVNQYNESNNFLNNKRNQHLEDLNQSVQNYLDKHVPND
jgi:hypothetical protein